MSKKFYNYAKKHIAKHKVFAKFFGVGTLNTLVDFLIFFFVANLLHVYPPFASILSTGITLVMSFYLNHSFVFKSQKSKKKAVLKFTLVTIFNVWVIQTTVIALTIYILGNTSYFTEHIWTLNLFAKLCGVGVSFILNFIGYRHIFKEDNNDQ